MKSRLFFLLAVLVSLCPGPARAQMNPYFTAINYPVPKGALMLMLLADYQSARFSNNFLTGMIMGEYGITPRWTAGMMVDGQKVFGMPATYGGLRFNTYYQLFPHDNLLHFTLYGEYEDLNAADLYKMEVSGFGGEDLTEPLAVARDTPAHTFEQRAIVYHDWGRVNFTFNFISEYALNGSGNSFGYVWGLFKQPEYMGMNMSGMNMPGMNMTGMDREGMNGGARTKQSRPDMQGMPGMGPMPGMSGTSDTIPPLLSTKRLGYGLEMMGALGDNHQFGFYWNRQQQYLGPVFVYIASPAWSLHLEPTFGLSHDSDPVVIRTGVGYSFGGF